MLEVKAQMIDDCKYKFGIIEVDILKIDESYQRGVSELKVKRIIRNFDFNAFNCIFVNKRDNGEFYLVDGQHRTVAAKRLNIKKVPCMLYEGLSKKRRSRIIFILSNK